ncbi:MAG: DUF2194 domain-containing protein [Selenomonadaceae bacterium]|nr:DUF2194 domain-containing protein [Selenomonadaceae bacterium]
MHKRGIYLITAIVVSLALLFQLIRTDVFLDWQHVLNTAIRGEQERQGEPAEDLAPDHFVIIYDPENVASVFARHHLEEMLTRQKKTSESIPFDETVDEIPAGTCGVLIAMGDLGSLVSVPAIEQYVEDGGTAAVLIHPDAGREPLPEGFLRQLGITSTGGWQTVRGVDVKTDFLLGGKGFHFGAGTAYTTDTTAVTLADDVELQMTAETQEPLLWERHEGAGKYIVYNGSVRDDKTNTGLLAAILSHCGEETLYPVLDSKLFFIDDFPSPSPKGVQEKIQREYGVTTANFYRNIWWPYMLQKAREYDLRYTGLIIETYNDQIKPPFTAPNDRQGRDNLIVYGRELLDAGGELGIHGYNHQSLAPDGYGQGELDYIPWESKEDMVASLQELRRYVYASYPDYTFQVYVPPSNILSPEGKEAVKEVFPELKVYASLFDGLYKDKCYYQDFKRNDDGTYELPRLSSGYSPKGLELWQDICGANYFGIFSHFIHPDEIFFKETGDKGWKELSAGFDRYLREIYTRYSWLHAETASECADALGDIIDMDYRTEQLADGLRIVSWGWQQPLHFILRTPHTVEWTQGCTVTQLDGDAWLIEVTDADARLYWAKE